MLVSKYVGDEDDFFEYLRPYFALDIVGFFHAAYVQSGNMCLAPYINRLDEILADVIVTHRQTNGKHDFIYLVFNALSIYDEELDGQLYRECRFDKLTGWRDFYDSLSDFVYNYEEESEILTPISEHIVGRWDLKELFQKRFNEWIPVGNNATDLGVMIFRPNNEVVRVSKGGEFTRLSINHWSITEENKIKLTDFDDYPETDILQLAENDLVLMETTSYSKVKVHFQRANDTDRTLAERMVGKWTLSKRFKKVNGEWVEEKNLPVEAWTEFSESGLLNSYTREFTTSEGIKSDNIYWRVHEETGTVVCMNPVADGVPIFFRIALEDNDNTMIMNHSENFNPKLEEQTTTEYKDILIRN